jgi:hypothetical protein
MELVSKRQSWVLLGEVDSLCCFFLKAFIEEERLQFFSLASSVSICSCLHSSLQNGVSPLQIQTKLPSFNRNNKGNKIKINAPQLKNILRNDKNFGYCY